MMISLIMFSVLGILGVQLMSGMLVHCSDNTVYVIASQVIFYNLSLINTIN
jgi:hypothetical protein